MTLVNQELIGKTNQLMGLQIIGVGSAVPNNVVSNSELEKSRGFDSNWIVKRTGILERRLVVEGESTSDLAVAAAEKAINDSGVDRGLIDVLIVATSTPDYTCPSVACIVQDRLGLNAAAFDINAACSGFTYALITGSQFIKSGNARHVLVIGADCISRIVDPNDSRIAPLFGDGAGAVVLSQGGPTQGFLSYHLGSDGRNRSLLYRPMGGALFPGTFEDISEGRQYVQMDGRAVFKWAVQAISESVRLVLDQAKMNVSDVELFLFHQANIRIINGAAKALEIPESKIHINLSKYGNTSAASIPLVLSDVTREGLVRRGNLIVMAGFGAGLTWGTTVMRW